jgi:energy-converting hydrogenase B subunit Q
LELLALIMDVENVPGALRDIAGVIADHGGNIVHITQESEGELARLYVEIEGVERPGRLVSGLRALEVVRSVRRVRPLKDIYGKRVIIMGGGAQVAEVAKGAITEADRHNIRGERISVDTIPLVGEENLAEAVRAVARLPRVGILVLAGSLMGGKITDAVRELREERGIPVISLNMAGSVPEEADLVVTDPVQAGVMAVMAVSSAGVFDLSRVRGRRF